MEFKLTKNSEPISFRKKHGSRLPSTVGLDIEANSIAASELGGGGTLGRTAIAPLPKGTFTEGEIRNADALTDALRTLFKEHDLSRTVRLGIANQAVVVRTLKLPLIENEKELESAIRFQANDQIPMPLDQAVLDYRVLRRQPGPEGERQMDVLVVAARRDMITGLLGVLREAGLSPSAIDLSAFGMIRALSNGNGNGSAPAPAPALDEQGNEIPGTGALPGATVLYCYLGAATNLVVGNDQDCLFTRISPVGVETIAESVAEKEDISVDDAREWLLDVGLDEPVDENFGSDQERASVVRAELEDGAAKLLNELRLSLDYYGAQEGALPIEQVVVCGLGSKIPGLVERLQDGLGRPIEVRTPAALSHLDDEDAARLTISYGLALEA
jgi:type IV pilus assembly protein PilM